ncbi:MAG: beta-mannosidase [Planctomycetia bacterium]|nr:beta-mannosidase [Planctomycetia bacterium]
MIIRNSLLLSGLIALTMMMFCSGSYGAENKINQPNPKTEKPEVLTENVFRITPRSGYRNLDLSSDWLFGWLDQMPKTWEEADQALAGFQIKPDQKSDAGAPNRIIKSVETSDKTGAGGIWWKMTRPMAVEKALFYAGAGGDPYYGMNSKTYDWIHGKTWCFKKIFEFSKEIQNELMMKDGYFFLSFDGLDYHSTVWFNGTKLGNHEGMFGGPEFEVSKYINKTGSNILLVFVDSAKKREPWIQGTKLGKAIKPWGTSGGDNAKPFFSFGLWRGVRIDAMPKIHLERPYLVTKEAASDKALLHFETEIFANKHSFEFELHPPKNRQLIDFSRRNPNRTKVSGEFKICVTFQNSDKTGQKIVKEYPFDLYEERNWFRTDLTIDTPALWYPNQLGKPPLYNVCVELFREGEPLDRIEFPFGIRSIRWEETPGPKLADRWGKWQCVVNDKKFMIKGINWLPIDALCDLPKEKYRWYLNMAKDAGIQLIRIWGAGLQEAEEFYDLCDEFGLMVWQDFPIGNTDIGIWEQVPWESQIMNSILRLRNRASLAVWCGGNEFNPYCPGNSAPIGIIERNLQIFDPSRKFVRTSPDEGSFHTYPDMDPTWYKKNYKEYPALAESGIHSISSTRSMIDGLIDPKEFQFVDKMYLDEYRTLCPESIHHFVEYYPRRIPRMLSRASHITKIEGISFDDLALGTQLGAGEFYQIFSEGMQGNYPVTALQMPWVLARTWPVISGVQLIDGTGQPVAPYYFLKRTYEQIHVAFDLDRILWKQGEMFPNSVKILNLSNAKEGSGTLSLTILDDQFTKKYHAEKSVKWSAAPSVTVNDFNDWTVPDDYRNRFFFVIAELKNGKNLISRTVYWPRTISAMSDDSGFYQKYISEICEWPRLENGPWLKDVLKNAPKAEIALEILEKKSKRDGQYRITDYLLKVSNKSTVPSPINWFDLKETSPKFYAGDNFFWLAPGEMRIIPMKVRENWTEQLSSHTVQLKNFQKQL